MLSVTRRPPTAGELTQWHRRYDMTPRKFMEVAGYFLVPVVCGWSLGLMVGTDTPGKTNLAPTISLVLGGVGFLISSAVLVLYLVKRDPPPRPPSEVEDVRVAASQVLQKEAFGDEGPIYLFQAEPEKLVLLFGNWMWTTTAFGGLEGPEEELFPSTEFRVIHDPKSGMVFDLEPLGALLKPVRTVDDEFRDYVLLPKVCVMDGTLDAYEAAVRKVAGTEEGKFPKPRKSS